MFKHLMDEQIPIGRKLKPSNNFVPTPQLKARECVVCYDFTAEPMRCSKCKSQVVCKLCLPKIRSVKSQCPVRCDGTFKTEKVPKYEPQYYCPFNLQACGVLPTLTHYQEHLLDCIYKSEEQRYFVENRHLKKCSKGLHQLEYLMNLFQPLEAHCSGCHEEITVESACRSCDQYYCAVCRPIPVKTNQCPIGHSLHLSPVVETNFSCDICKEKMHLRSKFYDDPCCNFGICRKCYERAQTNKTQATMLSNQPEYCDRALLSQGQSQKNKHLLFLVSRNMEQNLTTCSHCHKDKLCRKYCKTCQQHYCFTCKPFMLNNNDDCADGHAIMKVTINLQNTNPTCDKCEKVIAADSQSYSDVKCDVLLCQQCYHLTLQIVKSRHRFQAKYLCNLNHSLTYLLKPVYNQCFKCHEIKQLRLKCQTCWKYKMYCHGCMPLPDRTKCYFKHPLTEMKKTASRKAVYKMEESENHLEEMMCHICSKVVGSKMKCYECRQCKFLCCDLCMNDR